MAKSGPRLSREIIKILAIGFFALQSSAFAGLSEIAVSAGYPTAMGNYYETLSSPTSVQAEIWFSGFLGLSDDYLLHFSENYSPYGVININGNINMLGTFAGLQIQTGRTGGLGFMPFFQFNVGAAYDWLTFNGQSNTTQQTGLSFATQVVPGFDIQIWKSIGLIVELPISQVYIKNTLVIFAVNGGLRWQL